MDEINLVQLPSRDGDRTFVWISENEVKRLVGLSATEDGRRLIKSMRRYAEAGFDDYCGDKRPVRLKWDGVFAIQGDYTLFRLIGFFLGVGAGEFAIIVIHKKKGRAKGKGMDPRYQRAVQRVVEVRNSGHWRKDSDDETLDKATS